MITKIITHNGIFHADDVMSVALLLEFIRPSIQVERTRNISPDEFINPDIWIVDVGGQYNRGFNNYDHHHDSTLPAACMLVLTELSNQGLINEHMHAELFDNIFEISDIDCNGPADKNGFQVNSLIKSFNSIENGFEIAVDVCRKYIQACKASVAKAEESKAIWDRGEKVSGMIKVCDSFPVHWKRYEEEMFLVYPQDGKWNIITRDSATAPLADSPMADFMHANKFLAVFSDKKDAMNCAHRSAIFSKMSK